MARGRNRGTKSQSNKSDNTAARLRRLTDDFWEQRFEPKTSYRQVIGVLGLSLGGVALGVGVYATWLRDASLEPIGYAPVVMVAGVVLVLLYFMFGYESLGPLRVGELGVGTEKDGKVTRIAWCDISSIAIAHGALNLKTTGKPLTISLELHREAARHIVREALKRVPKTVTLEEDDRLSLGEPTDDGQRVSAEPPQVAGLSCANSDKPLTFEKDVRMCSRCGALYHRTAVPRRCVSCGKKLQRD